MHSIDGWPIHMTLTGNTPRVSAMGQGNFLWVTHKQYTPKVCFWNGIEGALEELLVFGRRNDGGRRRITRSLYCPPNTATTTKPAANRANVRIVMSTMMPGGTLGATMLSWPEEALVAPIPAMCSIPSSW